MRTPQAAPRAFAASGEQVPLLPGPHEPPLAFRACRVVPLDLVHTDPDGLDRIDELELPRRQIEEEAFTWKRSLAVAWVSGHLTRGGRDRGACIAGCGQLHAAKISSAEGTVYGVAHAWCRQRACPSCAARKAVELRAHARAHYKARLDAGVPESRFAVATLTQPKLPAAPLHVDPPDEGPEARGNLTPTWETASMAVDRLVRARQYLSFRSRTLRRLFPETVAGMVWAVELKFSDAGVKHKHGPGESKFAGYHAHYHCIVEFTAPPSWFRAEFNGFSEEHIETRWGARCRDDLRSFWRRAVNYTGHNVYLEAQKVVALTDHNLGQVAKYIVEGAAKVLRDAPEREALERMREAFRALEHRRQHAGWGTWQGWTSAAEDDDIKIELTGIDLRRLLQLVRDDKHLLFEEWIRDANGKAQRVPTDRVDARALAADTRRIGCTLNRFAAKLRKGTATMSGPGIRGPPDENAA